MKKYDPLWQDLNNLLALLESYGTVEKLVKEHFAKKTAHTLELLGCSIDYLKQHIESQFEDGMCWKSVMNGEIHIDHIVPCIAFDLSQPSQQRECFHWSNLQPLWAKDNFKKATNHAL